MHGPTPHNGPISELHFHRVSGSRHSPPRSSKPCNQVEDRTPTTTINSTQRGKRLREHLECTSSENVIPPADVAEVIRVLTLRLKDLGNKSDELLRSNPVHKKVPMLVHGSRALPESVIILRPARSSSPTPSTPRTLAQFWCHFIDNKLGPAMDRAVFASTREDQEVAVQQVHDNLALLEADLRNGAFRGPCFFDGNEWAAAPTGSTCSRMSQGCASWAPTSYRFPLDEVRETIPAINHHMLLGLAGAAAASSAADAPTATAAANSVVVDI
ncbi:hypothetical protein HU200_026029 [Digitaria exilis]|uniref:GST N-terminal domain-containing protein n=1 Tax=Digitaria exilis TaxID=1010633 RepID=A0A835ES56_9POAL|nr:hypothetical protein HU200_026029 [Digitaria exilis]